MKGVRSDAHSLFSYAVHVFIRYIVIPLASVTGVTFMILPDVAEMPVTALMYSHDGMVK